jgi:predicted Fe-S protein YdhL (DUF1289 family)
MTPNEGLAKFPCVRKCCLDDSDTCLGCFRTLEEITHWNEAGKAERKAILEKAQQRKAAYKARVGDYFSAD